MEANHASPLDYATASPPVNRWRILRVIPPYSGGILVGGLLAYGILACGPTLSFASMLFDAYLKAFPFGLFIAALYALTVAFALSGSNASRVARDWRDCASIGAMLPAMGIGLASLVHLLSLSPSSAPTFEFVGLGISCLLTMLVAIAVPFFLVQRQATNSASNIVSFRRRINAVNGAFLAGVVLLVIGQWVQARAFDRDCANVIQWVKASHPTPGVWEGLALPAQFNWLSADHNVDAIVLADGRTILTLKTSLFPHDNWAGVVYSSGPIRPGEMGVDAYGQPMIVIPGLADQFFITRQVDSRRFCVMFNLG